MKRTLDIRTDKKRELLPIDAAGTLICLAVSLVVYLTALSPLIEKRFFLADQRKKLVLQQQEALNLGASMRTLDNQLTVVQEKLAKNEIRLKSADRINQRVAELTALFNDCSLEVDDVQTGKISTGPRCSLVPIDFAGRGGYKQCIAFIQKLYSTSNDISVARFELDGNPAKLEQLGSFRFQLFWHTAPKAKTAINQTRIMDGAFAYLDVNCYQDALRRVRSSGDG